MTEQETNNLGAKDLAGQNFKSGYNCAESVVRGFRDFYKLDISDEALRMASGFGGGLGHAGCMCGALSGAIMVLGMLQGRSTSEQNRGPIYSSSKDFHSVFIENFGATCCRVLNKHEFGTRDQGRNCIKITARTAELLEKFIQDNQLIKK